MWVVLCCAFDNGAGGTVLGIARFRQDFGYAFDGNYALPAKWQSAYSGGPAAASVIGTYVGGYFADWIGRKYTIMGGLPHALCWDHSIGGLLTIAMTYYIGELSPMILRGILTAAAAISFTLGSLVLGFIFNAYGDYASSWAYKSSFVAQYGITGIAMLIWPFMRESPTWLISHGKEEQAKRSLRRLGESPEKMEKTMANIKLTLENARKETDGVTYLECFKRSNLRRTIIASAPLTIQAFYDVFFVAGYATYYTQLAGYSTAMSYKLNIVQQVLSMLGNITSWFLVERLGRRFRTFWGLVVLTVVLLLAGELASAGKVGTNKATVGVILAYCYIYNGTIGATAYVALAEIGTSRLRAKTAAIAILTQGCFSCMWQFVLPYLFNPNAANLQAKVSFIFGGFSVLCCVYLWFYHPETKGRSYEELDEMFMKGVLARQFSSYVTEAESKGQEVKREMAHQDATL